MTKLQSNNKPKMILAEQVSLFLDGEQQAYQAFESLLKAVLSYGAKEYTYNSTVGARVKGPASFAEKCIRKSKYTFPVYELTDLCGARVVANTLDEVDRLCTFVENSFVVDKANSEDKLSILRTSEFSYRSVHFIVQVDLERLKNLPINIDLKAFVDQINKPKKGASEPFLRKAEIQVRTIMQHVWADTLHDRIYKSGIKIPKALERESHRIAALLDKADEDLLHLNEQIDAYAKDYASHLSPESLKKELNIVESLVNQECLKPKEKGEQVLRLLKLHASARQWKVIQKKANLRKTYDSTRFLNAFDHLFALAKCRLNVADSGNNEFQSGLKTLIDLSRPIKLEKAPKTDVGARLDFISEALAGSEDGHGRIQRDPVRSQLMADLAWAQFRNSSSDPNFKNTACETMFQAHLLDSTNPYIYGDQVWLQLKSESMRDFLRYSWTAIEAAMDKCLNHLDVGLDRNRGWATLGRFHLLRSEWSEAGQAYACLITSATSSEILTDEAMLLKTSEDLLKNTVMAPYIGLLVRTLNVAAALYDAKDDFVASKTGSVLIVAGTCSTEKSLTIESYREAIIDAVSFFDGLVISGGTTTGIAGMIETAFKKGCPSSSLIGFTPCRPELQGKTYAPYAEIVQGDLMDFGIESVVQYWELLLERGYLPSQVRVLGVGGGPISRFEYDLALALGATVGLVRGSGREADLLLKEPTWWNNGRLVDLFDNESILLFCAHVPSQSASEGSLEERLASLIHEGYLNDFMALPEQMRPWDKLEPKYKTANYDQAKAIQLLLGRFGFEVHSLGNAPEGMKSVKTLEEALSQDSIEALAKMEHARWSLERNRAGWRYDKTRDNDKKLHPNLVPWSDLDENTKLKDFQTVKGWILYLKACDMGVFVHGRK